MMIKIMHDLITRVEVRIAILHFVSITRGQYTILCVGIFGGLEYKNITF